MDRNPLFDYFRQPGIHIKLPTNGKYNSQDMIDFSPGNEVAVYPMTAADEIILSNPDSLLNGAALERIILSCCPAVKNARDITVPDADVIIIASKLVSYGDAFPLHSACPKCGSDKAFTLSIRSLLDEVTPLPEEHSVRLNDSLVAYLRPYTLNSNNRINLTQFEQTKLIQNLIKENMEEETRASIIANAFQKITNLTLDLLSECIIKISAPNNTVSDPNMIKEFVNNSARDTVQLIRDSLKEFNNYGLPKETEITCDNDKCKNVWKVPIVYDPSSFFGLDS